MVGNIIMDVKRKEEHSMERKPKVGKYQVMKSSFLNQYLRGGFNPFEKYFNLDHFPK